MPAAARAPLLLSLLVATAPAAKSAVPEGPGREKVLKQVRVPHHYYYREMYLPQATSGASSPAWSPDGKELAASIEGSLWRIELATGVARQLTDGPGYDYQPDWSPDGGTLVYASYQGDALELRALDLASGCSRPLTSNGAVNLDPRFSPDGKRIAFVSTAHEGRFHVFRLDLRAGTPGEPVRLSEERGSGLPRYYYSRYDHYLSPAWSPDGRELLLVSNRGRISGSGGLWRMGAEPGATMRPVLDEETSWKARPDWARDGRRVVYASYAGRQWHQLWLAPATGGDAFPLTYGDYDATSPRWSPDGARIVYVSNEDGAPALWTIDLPGGARRRVEIRERHRLGATGRLVIDVTENGRSVPARVSVTTPDGRSFVPEGAWRHADDYYDRSERRIEHGYFHGAGRATVDVPAGPITLEVTRGLEYRPVRRRLEVEAGATRDVAVALERLADWPSRGWWSGDLHVHMNYGGAYRATPATLRAMAEAEDLHVVFNLVVNKEQRVPDVSWFTGRADPVSTSRTLVRHDQEFHTSWWGHLSLLGLTSHLLLPDYAGYAGTAAWSLDPPNARVAGLARDQGALVGYVHPFDDVPEPLAGDAAAYPLPGFASGDPVGLPIDVALGMVDFYEAVGLSDHRATNTVWYRLLNCGFRLPAGAGTDAMTNYASLRGPVGLNRVFVKTGGPLDFAGFLAGLAAGRSMATNGPLVELGLRPRGSSGPWSEPGDALDVDAGGRELEARMSLRSIVPVDRLELVRNGEVVASLPLSGDRTTADATLTLPAAGSGWYLARAHCDRSRHPVLDFYPFGTTSPVYVTAGGVPVRSPADARYFVRWIDRVRASAAAHGGWNTEAEKRGVLELVDRARAVFEERAR